MSIATYADLQTAVGNWLHRGDMAAVIPDLIRLGELRIFREIRCRVMETALSGTITNGLMAVPASYVDLKFAYIDATPTSILSRTSASSLYEQYPNRTATGKPVLIAREGSNFIFGPNADSSYTVSGIYYALPTSIQSSANALFLANPDLYLMAALCEAAPYIKDDPRIAVWENKYLAIKSMIDNEAAEEYGSGGGLAVLAA